MCQCVICEYPLGCDVYVCPRCGTVRTDKIGGVVCQIKYTGSKLHTQLLLKN